MQSAFVTSLDGMRTQERIWNEISDNHEKIQPDITREIQDYSTRVLDQVSYGCLLISAVRACGDVDL